MSCFHPATAYRLTTVFTEKGKSQIVFSFKDIENKPYERISLKCGRCDGCIIDRSRDWAIRCVHEASMYDENCFITLTFAEKYLNESGTLVKSDFQKFMKRLRKKYFGRKIRYYHCGEYGSKMSRPHHHACLFNFDFPDKVLWSERNGVLLYRSEILEKLWPFGFCTVGEVTFESAAYVARYIMKKIHSSDDGSDYVRLVETTGELVEILPEYTTMSRRPGIARDWFAKFSGDVFPKDFVTLAGRKVKSPRYYDLIYDEENPDGFDVIKKKRRTAGKKKSLENDGRRLREKEKCLVAKVKRLIREI